MPDDTPDMLDLPDELTLNDADRFRRRRRGGEPVDPDVGRREVVDLFAEYVRRAGLPGGDAGLRGARDDWKAKHDAARADSCETRACLLPYEETRAAVQAMLDHYGPTARVRDAVTPDGRTDYDSEFWASHTVTRPSDGAVVVTLWTLDRWGRDSMEQGRCVSGDQTWIEACADAAESFDTYRRLLVQADDRGQDAGMREDVARYVLDLYDAGRLNPTTDAEPHLAEVAPQRPELLLDARAFAARVREHIMGGAARETAYDLTVVEAGGSRCRSFYNWDRSVRKMEALNAKTAKRERDSMRDPTLLGQEPNRVG